MVTTTPRPVAARSTPPRKTVKGSAFSRVLRTTDHKVIGMMYLVTAFSFFLLGGLMAMMMRAELARPGYQYLSPEQYNQLFTMHGTIMLLMFATPLFFAFSNLVLPLQIGAPDVAFPRLNAFSYWLFLLGSLTNISGFLTPDGAPGFGWFAYTPLSDGTNLLPVSAGSPIRHCPTGQTHPASARTCGSSGWASQAWAPSSARSTSSPPSSACAPRE